MSKLSLKQMTNKDDDNTPQIVVNEDTQPVSDEVSLMAIGELFNKAKLKGNSRVKPEQVSNLVKLYAFAKVFKTPFASSLADLILQLQISLNGLGRRELVQLVQQRSNEPMIMTPQTSKQIFK